MKLQMVIDKVKKYKSDIENITSNFKFNIDEIILNVGKFLNLDKPLIKGILFGLLLLLPPTQIFIYLNSILTITCGIVENYKENNGGLIKEEDINKIIEEIKNYISQIKNTNDDEIRKIFKGQQEELNIILEIKEKLSSLDDINRKLDLIYDEIKQFGFKNIQREIADTTDFGDYENDIERFYSFLTIHSYNPFIHDYDYKRKDIYEIEKLLEDNDKIGLLILGESGSGKTTILKRVAYNFMLKGWNVFIKIKSDFDIEKLVNQLNSLNEKSLLIIDNAIDSGESRLRDLIENLGKLKDRKIKFLMAETVYRFIDEKGEYKVEEKLFKQNYALIYKIKLDKEDLNGLFEKFNMPFSESLFLF